MRWMKRGEYRREEGGRKGAERKGVGDLNAAVKKMERHEKKSSGVGSIWVKEVE